MDVLSKRLLALEEVMMEFDVKSISGWKYKHIGALGWFGLPRSMAMLDCIGYGVVYHVFEPF